MSPVVKDRILVTGANGFIGQHLCSRLVASGHEVIACMRTDAQRSMIAGKDLRIVPVDDLCVFPGWGALLAEVDAVVHLAARVHVMRERSTDPLAEFRAVNVGGTSNLARHAALAGVRRFLYLSSIKVNGESTGNAEFRADDRPGFADPYGQSKWEAEQQLIEIAEGYGMEWVVLRPTLVYGPEVRGNFLRLLRWVHRGVPLPLAGVHNRRSLVSVYNLVDLLDRAIGHRAASGQVFLVKDAEDVSTGELARRIAHALHRSPRVIPVPAALMAVCSRLLGQQKAAQRLFGSLVVNTEKTTELLGWQAPVSLDYALAQTCTWYRSKAAAGRN